MKPVSSRLGGVFLLALGIVAVFAAVTLSSSSADQQEIDDPETEYVERFLASATTGDFEHCTQAQEAGRTQDPACAALLASSPEGFPVGAPSRIRTVPCETKPVFGEVAVCGESISEREIQPQVQEWEAEMQKQAGGVDYEQ
jgi:hypothetical protein